MNYENMETLRSRLGNFDAGSLLDVAVGRGDFLKFVLRSFRTWKSAAGIDIDAESLQSASRDFNNTPVILVLGSALEMPFMTRYFDTVTMSNALHHIENLSALFMESCRVCKSRGMIVVNEMLNENYNRLQESYMLYHRLMANVDNQLGLFHREPFTLKELQQILKNSRMTILDFFIHEEISGDYLNREEIDQMSERLLKKVQLLRGSDFYYFYENKVREIIHRLEKMGVMRPRHITFILQPECK
jgi:ubiquinone/menaquinone biosynthesis C-methylase UbiE